MSPKITTTADQLTSSCRAKLDWADMHLDSLNREIDAWGNTNPFTIRRECDADGREHIFTAHFDLPPGLFRWALTLSDALHSLRGALDNLVYALAIAQSRKDPPDGETKLAFPICSDARFFKAQRYRIAPLNERTQAAIERLQPYNRLKPGQWFAPLWYLAQLNDADKHRLLHLSTTTMAHFDDIAIDADPGTFTAYWNHGNLEDGAPILRLLLDQPNPNVDVDLKATAAVALQFVEHPPMSLYWTAKHIRREVNLCCRYLTYFFAA